MQSYIEIIRLSNIEHQSPRLPQCAFRHQRQRETATIAWRRNDSNCGLKDSITMTRLRHVRSAGRCLTPGCALTTAASVRFHTAVKQNQTYSRYSKLHRFELLMSLTRPTERISPRVFILTASYLRRARC